MNIYEKIQEIRCELQNIVLKKSGKNKFAGYEYFELKDFLPTINELMKKYKITSTVSFSDIAVLTLINIEKPEEREIFTSPMSSANLKGCHEVQNLGAVQTYLRRYLYVNAFEIVESDPLEATTGQDNKSDNVKTLSEAQVKRAYTIANSVGVTNEQVKQWIMTKYKKTSVNQLSKNEYDELVSSLEAKKAG